MTTWKNPWWSPWREAGGALILHVDLRPDEEREQRALDLLDEDERNRWDRFAVQRARRQFALCRAALRINLCGRLACGNHELSFGYREHGKPFARVNGAASPISCNVSHSGAHGLIAFSKHEDLGIDLEERVPDRNYDGIGGRVFRPAEQGALTAATGPRKAEVFYRLWTLKEALIKALGTGFSLSPSRFEVPRPLIEGERSALFRFPHRPSGPFWLEDLGEPRFAAAVAWRLPSPNTVSGRHGNAD